MEYTKTNYEYLHSDGEWKPLMISSNVIRSGYDKGKTLYGAGYRDAAGKFCRVQATAFILDRVINNLEKLATAEKKGRTGAGNPKRYRRIA